MPERRRGGRILLWAVGLSLLLHLGVLFPPFGLLSVLPGKAPEAEPLRVHLQAQPPAPVARPSPPPRTPEPPAPRPRRSSPRPVPTPAPDAPPAVMTRAGPATADAVAVGTGQTPAPQPGKPGSEAGMRGATTSGGDEAPAAAPPVLKDGRPWPGRGRVVYDVHRGEGGLILGETVHTWEHDDSHYLLRAEVSTTGLAALLKRFSYVQQSLGRLGPGGLVPEQFSVRQTGRRSEQAVFDWARGQVTISRSKGDKVAPLQPGDQDVLSLWHQLAFGSGPRDGGHLTVVSGKGAAPAVLHDLGSEMLRLPQGDQPVAHWQVRAEDGSLRIDLWLGLQHGYVPLRIRIEDRGGEVVDQIAREVEVEGAADLPPPPQTAPMSGDEGTDYR